MMLLILHHFFYIDVISKGQTDNFLAANPNIFTLKKND